MSSIYRFLRLLTIRVAVTLYLKRFTRTILLIRPVSYMFRTSLSTLLSFENIAKTLSVTLEFRSVVKYMFKHVQGHYKLRSSVEVRIIVQYLEPEPGLLTYQSLLCDPNGGMLYKMTLKLVQMKQVLERNRKRIYSQSFIIDNVNLINSVNCVKRNILLYVFFALKMYLYSTILLTCKLHLRYYQTRIISKRLLVDGWLIDS